MTDQDIHSEVVKWLSGLTSVKVIKAYQSRGVPLPYIMVNLTTVREVRAHEQEVEYQGGAVPDPIEAAPVIETEWMFSVNAYAVNPTDVLRPLRSAAKLSQMNEPLMPAYTVHTLSQIRHVPEWINEAWEPRSQMDLFLRGLVRDQFAVDVVEQYSFDFEKLSP